MDGPVVRVPLRRHSLRRQNHPGPLEHQTNSRGSLLLRCSRVEVDLFFLAAHALYVAALHTLCHQGSLPVQLRHLWLQPLTPSRASGRVVQLVLHCRFIYSVDCLTQRLWRHYFVPSGATRSISRCAGFTMAFSTAQLYLGLVIPTGEIIRHKRPPMDFHSPVNSINALSRLHGRGTRGIRPQSGGWGETSRGPMVAATTLSSRRIQLPSPSPGATPLRDRGEARYVGHGWGWGARQWSGPPDQQTTPASA